MRRVPMGIGRERRRNVQTLRHHPLTASLLRSEIQRHLQAIGLNGSRPQGGASEGRLSRQTHRFHREAAQQRIRRALGDKINLFLEEIANGDEVDPANIRP